MSTFASSSVSKCSLANGSSQVGVEALGVAVLPRAARFDEQRRCADASEPPSHLRLSSAPRFSRSPMGRTVFLQRRIGAAGILLYRLGSKHGQAPWRH